jgi:hypothetical protein
MTQTLPPDIVAVLERGERARELLESTAFIEIVDDMTQQHIAQLVACPPGAKYQDAREHAHLMQHGLTEIVATIRSYVATADDLRRAIEHPIDVD